jgi:hypothetical protein
LNDEEKTLMAELEKLNALKELSKNDVVKESEV